MSYPYPALAKNQLSLHPEDVAHERQQLLSWWSQPGKWQRWFALQGRNPLPGWTENREVESEDARRWMAETIKQAELYWVSPEMTEVITALAPSIPDCLPQPPVPDALVIFAKSIPGLDADTGGEISTSAFLWGTMELFRRGPVIAMETYAWRDLVHVYNGMTPKEQEAYRQVYPNRLMPTGGSEWELNAMTSDVALFQHATDDRVASIVEDRRLLATFWALASQKIVIETREQPYTRQQKRQAERKGYELPEIRVIRLREPTQHAAGAGESGREYSHRWIVGAHWRNQWYAREQTHRPKLIEAYVKGPEDKPLKVRETVRALVR